MKTKNGFSLIELLVVIAILAILAAMLLPALAVAKRRSLQLDQIPVLVHLMASNGINSSEPMTLTNGWYYVDGTQTNANNVLASFIHQVKNDGQNFVNVYSGLDGDYGSYPESQVIAKVADKLGIRNGYFIYVTKRP